MIGKGRILVIGGNAAGPAAAAKAKRVNPELNIIMFEAGKFISTGTCEIPYVLSGEISSYEKIIFYNEEKFKSEKGVEVFTNHLVTEINRKEKFIVSKNLNDNSVNQHYYDKLIIATGSKPKRVNYLPENAANVFTLKSISDLIKLKEFFSANNIKTAAVIGSGYLGLEVVDALKKINLEIILIEKEKLVIPSAETEISFLVQELLKKHGIMVYRNIINPKVNFENGKVISLEIDSRVIEFDLIITAAGFVPNSELAEKSKIELGMFGGIKVDNRLKTSDQNIFAAGDNIEIKNAVTNKNDYIPLATLAHEYGHIAGANAAGLNINAEPTVKNLSFKIFDKFYNVVGLSSSEAEKYGFYFSSISEVVPNLIKVMPGSENVFGKIIYEKNSKRILGAAFFGGKEVAEYGDIISILIKTKQTVNILSSINYNYTPPLSPMINLLSVLGRKIK